MGFQINDPFDWSLPRAQVRIKDSGGTFIDVTNRLVSLTTVLNNGYAADTFSVELSNHDGYVSSTFARSREIEISATFNQVEMEKILVGRIEKPKTSYTKRGGATAVLTGKDYIAELQNRFATEVYKNGTFTASTDPYIGEIIRDLLTKYAPSIDGSLVPDTATQISYKVFVRTPIYDCIKFLADLISYRFYVNTDKQLVFEPIPTSTLVSDTFTGLSGDPSGWTEESGTWAKDNNQYRQSNASGSFTTYRTSETIADGVLDCYINITSGTRAGVCVRIDGSGNHYFIALDLAENLVKLYRVATWTGGDTELGIGVPGAALAAGTTYRLRVFWKEDGNEVLFHVFLDDMRRPVLSYRDDSGFSSTGKVGLRTEDANASFDTFTAANAYLIIEEAFNAEEISVEEELPRMKNNVYVTGGYEKFPVVETSTPSGSTDEIALSYLASEVQVDVDTVGTALKGGIKGIDDADASVYWLLDYYAKKLYKRTGNWPANLTTVTYNKNVPVFANSQDPTTFTSDGVRDFAMTDKLLNTQTLVEDTADSLLARLQTVPQKGSAKVPAVVWGVIPGNYVLAKSPANELDDYTMMTAETVTVSFDKSGGLEYGFGLNIEDASLPLLLNSFENRLQKLERRDVPEVPTHIETLADSASAQDAITGESNDVSAAFKFGKYAKFGHNRKFGNDDVGFTAAF